MTGFLLGLVRGGRRLPWAGAVCGADVRLGSVNLRRFVRQSELPLSPPSSCSGRRLGGARCSARLVARRRPRARARGAIGGAYAPFVWAGGRRGRRLRERERAWPAALAQLADALEAGIAFPAAVALVAETGPAALRETLPASTHGCGGGLVSAIDGLTEQGERTADTVAPHPSRQPARAGGRLAPVLRELAGVLSERLRGAREGALASPSLQLEAAILALSPIVLLLLVGAASPAYLEAYRTPGGRSWERSAGS